MESVADDLADRARAIAAAARLHPKADATFEREKPREWYVVTRAGETHEVFFCPPQSIHDVRTIWYPGAGVVPR